MAKHENDTVGRRQKKVGNERGLCPDSGCGVSVAPPAMRRTSPITGSEVSRRGQELMSACEVTKPDLEEQKLGVMLDSCCEVVIQLLIADVSRPLNAITEMCDQGPLVYLNHVVCGTRDCMIVKWETGNTDALTEGELICILDLWVELFPRQGS